MNRLIFFLVFLMGTLGWAGVSLEDMAREYLLNLRYNFDLGFGELRLDESNRICRVYINMPYVVVEGRVYYFEQGVSWETNGKMILPDEMAKIVREYIESSRSPRGLVSSLTNQTNNQIELVRAVTNVRTLSNTTNVPVTHQDGIKPLQDTNRVSSPTNVRQASPGVVLTNREQKSSSQTNQTAVKSLFRPIRTIILDPGHGGKDPGGIGRGGIREKVLVMELTRLLKKRFEAMGYRVILTRDGDNYVSLADRVDIAYERWNAQEGALFLSIHGNISLNPKVRGIEIYYLSDKASDGGASAVEVAENAGFSMDDVKHTESFYSVLNVLMREGVSRVSKLLSQEVQRSLKRSFSQVSVKSANFYVLRFSPLPAILWEVGYLSHSDESHLLQDTDYQEKLTQAFALGVDSFIKQYNARRGNL